MAELLAAVVAFGRGGQDFDDYGGIGDGGIGIVQGRLLGRADDEDVGIGEELRGFDPDL